MQGYLGAYTNMGGILATRGTRALQEDVMLGGRRDMSATSRRVTILARLGKCVEAMCLVLV